jgi:hypothetical protein
MGLLDNCTINTARSATSGSGATSAPVAYLTGKKGHVAASGGGKFAYLTLPEAALEAELVYTVYPNVARVLPDIKMGDRVTAIYLVDGVTLWPGSNPNEMFSVVYTVTTDPGPLYCLHVFIKRETGGGPLY